MKWNGVVRVTRFMWVHAHKILWCDTQTSRVEWRFCFCSLC